MGSVGTMKRMQLGRTADYLGGDIKVFYCPSQNYFTKENKDYGIKNFGVAGKYCMGSYYARGPPQFNSSLGLDDPVFIDRFADKGWVTDIEIA